MERRFFDNARAKWKEKRESRLGELKAQSDILPPITGSIDEVLHAAELAANAQLELTNEEKRAALLDGFSMRYAEYLASFRQYSLAPDEEKKTALAESYQAFQDSMDAIKKDATVVAFLRETEFAKYFPEEDENIQETDGPSPAIDKKAKRRFLLQQRLTQLFVNAATSGDAILIEELAHEFYPNIEQERALGRLHSAISIVRKKLRAQGYEVTNSTTEAERTKGKKAIYHVEKVGGVSEAPEEAGIPKKSDQPVRETRLNALTYIVTHDDPNSRDVIEILGPTKAGKRKPHDLSRASAVVALQRNLKKLYRRVNSGVATQGESDTHHLLEQFLSANTCTLEEFQTYMKGILGFGEVHVEEFDTPDSQITYLDAPITDDVPFTRRDAVLLVMALSHYRNTINLLCRDCVLPDRETVNKLTDKLGAAMDVLEKERSTHMSPDNHVIEGRLAAIQHYVDWRNRPDFYETSEHVEEFEFYQVIYNLQMLESSQISINGETYDGLQLLALMFTDKRVRRFIADEVELRKRQFPAPASAHEVGIDSDTVVHSEQGSKQAIPVEVQEIEVMPAELTVTGSDETLSTDQLEPTSNDRKAKKNAEMRDAISDIIGKLESTPDLSELAGTAEVTRLFPSLTQTVFDNAVKKGYISADPSTKRSGIPLFDRESVALLLYLVSMKGKGGIRPKDVSAARKMIRGIFEESAE